MNSIETSPLTTKDLLLQSASDQLEFDKVLQHISGYCISDIGKEKILTLSKYSDPEELQEELERVDEFKTLHAGGLPSSLFDGIADCRQQLKKSKIPNAYLSANELDMVAGTIRCSRLVYSFFSNQEQYPFLKTATTNLHSNKLLERHISDAIDDVGNIKDTASKKLQTIRRDILDVSAKLRSRLNKILRQVVSDELVSDDFVSQREGRFVLPLKIENKRKVPGIIHGLSQTGQTAFLEPTEIIEMNNELSLLRNQEEREIIAILTTLTAEVGADANEFLSSIATLAHLDATQAKALFALKYGGIKPSIVPTNTVNFYKVRHPLLVIAKGISNVVPLNIEFNNGTIGHLISGPNAGGKTVALKSIALSLLMVSSGIFALGECHTNLREVFCAIGDKQSIEHDLSTFSSQLITLRDILSVASKDSFIVIDEICSGTDPNEGGALASGILDALIDRNAMFLVTTHQSSLKTYALQKEHIVNDSLEFDPTTLRPTYKFLSGIPGNSYAFALAERLGVQDDVLAFAQQYRSETQSVMEDTISVLLQYRTEAELLKEAAVKAESIAQKKKTEFEAKLADLKQRQNELIRTSKQEASEILAKANSIIENTIREVREQQKTPSEIKKDFDKSKQEVVASIEESSQPILESETQNFEAGDAVRLDNATEIGTVIFVEQDQHHTIVEFNSLKFRVKTSQLQMVSKKEQKVAKKSSQSVGSYSNKFDSKVTIDLRGKRVEEAIFELENAISDGLLSNLPFMYILHGKGTGALRIAIQQYLKKDKNIVSFREGELNEGGAGVTVVTF